MRKMMLLTALVMLGAAMSFGYTFPGAFVYDGLITYDHMALPLVPNALHFNVGAGYMMYSQKYDKDGEAQDENADYTLVGVPIDIGYSINERILADITLQVLSASLKPDTVTAENPESSATGLGDLWVKGRYLAPVGTMNLGGRLGIKIPVGKVDYTDKDLELGDDQMDVDVAFVAAMYPEMGFAMNGQVGFRYRMKNTVTKYTEDPLNPGQYIATDVDMTPGMLIYLHVEPGYSMGTEKAFQIYVPIGYETTMANKADDKTVDDSETNGLYVGLAPKYTLDANNTLGIKFLYPLMGKMVPKSMLVGVTYEGYIPM
jgi:hypothetical protein